MPPPFLSTELNSALERMENLSAIAGFQNIVIEALNFSLEWDDREEFYGMSLNVIDERTGRSLSGIEENEEKKRLWRTTQLKVCIKFNLMKRPWSESTWR